MEKIIQPIGTQPKYSEYFSNNQLITSKNINNITTKTTTILTFSFINSPKEELYCH